MRNNFVVPMDVKWLKDKNYSISLLAYLHYKLFNCADDDDCVEVFFEDIAPELLQRLGDMDLLFFFDYNEKVNLLELLDTYSLESIRVSLSEEYHTVSKEQFALIPYDDFIELGGMIAEGLLGELDIRVYLQLYKMDTYCRKTFNEPFYYSYKHLCSKLGFSYIKKRRDALKQSVDNLISQQLLEIGEESPQYKNCWRVNGIGISDEKRQNF